MKRIGCALTGLALACVAVPVVAQIGGYDGEQFVEDVAKGDNDKALDLLKGQPSLINARDFNGRTALMAAIENRDRDWTGYLLNQGADPNLSDSQGNTPLIEAAKMGSEEQAEWLIGMGAKVDDANHMGETALIIAVQQRELPLVKLLLDHGADPDKADSAQGFSARDYAKRDSRSPDILRAIEAKKPAG